jgi:hypothetical protein
VPVILVGQWKEAHVAVSNGAKHTTSLLYIQLCRLPKDNLACNTRKSANFLSHLKQLWLNCDGEWRHSWRQVERTCWWQVANVCTVRTVSNTLLFYVMWLCQFMLRRPTVTSVLQICSVCKLIICVFFRFTKVMDYRHETKICSVLLELHKCISPISYWGFVV